MGAAAGCSPGSASVVLLWSSLAALDRGLVVLAVPAVGAGVGPVLAVGVQRLGARAGVGAALVPVGGLLVDRGGAGVERIHGLLRAGREGVALGIELLGRRLDVGALLLELGALAALGVL